MTFTALIPARPSLRPFARPHRRPEEQAVPLCLRDFAAAPAPPAPSFPDGGCHGERRGGRGRAGVGCGQRPSAVIKLLKALRAPAAATATRCKGSSNPSMANPRWGQPGSGAGPASAAPHPAEAAGPQTSLGRGLSSEGPGDGFGSCEPAGPGFGPSDPEAIVGQAPHPCPSAPNQPQNLTAVLAVTVSSARPMDTTAGRQQIPAAEPS